MFCAFFRRPAVGTAAFQEITLKAYDALGMVETRGFVSLVEAAQAMAQAAEVDLVHYEKAGAGFLTVVVRGPLEEVRRAVGAGMAAAQRVGELVAAHVLPRVHPKLESLLPLGGSAETNDRNGKR